MVLLQIVLLAFASHYARARIPGIIKYYLLELCACIACICVVIYIKEGLQKRKKREERNIKKKQPLQYCPVDGVVPKLGMTRGYNYNWIIKDESKAKKEEKIENKKEDQNNEPKKVYKSPFEESINTDKKVLYKSPFGTIGSERVFIVLDSARCDDKYSLCQKHMYKNRVYRRLIEKYVLLMNEKYKGRKYIKKEEPKTPKYEGISYRRLREKSRYRISLREHDWFDLDV